MGGDRLLLMASCAVLAGACATLGQKPMPVEPAYRNDGFHEAVVAGCADEQACAVLVANARARLASCVSDYKAFVAETKAAGYRFVGLAPRCPGAVEQDLHLARRHEDAAKEAHRSGVARAAFAERERKEADERAAVEAADEARRAAQAAERERISQLAEDPSIGWSVASAYLCSLRANEKAIAAERAYARRVDAESGTVDLRERRDFAEDAIDTRARVKCLSKSITQRWQKPPQRCRGDAHADDELSRNLLSAMDISAMETCPQ
jgi:hypothetical protein